MSAQLKFKDHRRPIEKNNQGKVRLTELLARLQQEKKKERNGNIALSVVVVSAVTVFGIILSL